MDWALFPSFLAGQDLLALDAMGAQPDLHPSPVSAKPARCRNRATPPQCRESAAE
jgi:hypothetical protein